MSETISETIEKSMPKLHPFRTHNCGELRRIHVGEIARLAGWVATIRDHGGILFADIRDHYGITQAVFPDPAMVNAINKECVLSLTGIVELRDPDTVNSSIETGEVELRVSGIEVLSEAPSALPFQISESHKTREDLRLKYRYLDLRNPEVHKKIEFRSKVITYLRERMTDLGFLEMQTPILTVSSPEGARDYLVPSRKHHGMFYALPQAPQQFKQLLMTSGFDRYFQIAPCFRDEDARADRAPGEFYQLDFEMAFATQEDVLETAEKVMSDTFSRFASKPVTKQPFPRIPYKECMLSYGTDKPDLRNPLIIEDLTNFFADVEFKAFRGQQVRGIVAPSCAGKPRSFFEKLTEFALGIGMKGLGYIVRDGVNVADRNSVKGPIVKFLSDEKLGELVRRLSLKNGDVLFFISDVPKLVNKYAGQIRTELGERIGGLINKEQFSFCFIVDYPMYEIDDETGSVIFTHNPFSMPQGGMDALLTKDPLDIYAWQYDIVCNGVELSSGAVRNHRPDIMRKAFEVAGYGEEELTTKFPALYNAFQYGAAPSAGMAPGIDRIVMLLLNEENIREVIAFPMNSSAQDVMMGAPGIVSETQLREVHIKIRETAK